MRVISGLAKGTKLKAPAGFGVRPVQDRVKGSVFSILSDVSGLLVLDVFAGSGALGIEAISRGASFASFIESSRPAAESIKLNLEKCKFADRGKIYCLDFNKALKLISKNSEKFDLVFIDPPYFKGLIPKALMAALELGVIADGARIVAEHHEKELSELPAGFVLTDKREYGQTCVSFIKALKSV